MTSSVPFCDHLTSLAATGIDQIEQKKIIKPSMQFSLPTFWQVFLLEIKGSVTPFTFHFILTSITSVLFPQFFNHVFSCRALFFQHTGCSDFCTSPLLADSSIPLSGIIPEEQVLIHFFLCRNT